MLCDVFMETNHHFKFHEIIHNPNEYYKLNDTIIEQIDNSDKESFRKAQNIIKRIKGRNLYKYVAEVFLPTDFPLDDNKKII
jgi:ethanolamine utilization cobalamin adenosyltransferase